MSARRLVFTGRDAHGESFAFSGQKALDKCIDGPDGQILPRNTAKVSGGSGWPIGVALARTSPETWAHPAPRAGPKTLRPRTISKRHDCPRSLAPSRVLPTEVGTQRVCQNNHARMFGSQLMVATTVIPTEPFAIVRQTLQSAVVSPSPTPQVAASVIGFVQEGQVSHIANQ